jgi:hypothetical protein
MPSLAKNTLGVNNHHTMHAGSVDMTPRHQPVTGSVRRNSKASTQDLTLSKIMKKLPESKKAGLAKILNQ